MCGTSIMRPPASVVGTSPPKIKEKRRNSEKRKEKSRDAARCRRGKESEIFNEMLSYLPLSPDVANTLDKMSILRLALNSFRLKRFIDALKKDSGEQRTASIEKEILSNDDPILDFTDGFVIVLSDDGEQLEPIFVSQGVQTVMGLAVSELLGVSFETFVHPCDYQELRDLYLSFKEGQPTSDKVLQIRMKCTISAKGRVVNIKSASYKVVKFQVKVINRNQKTYLTAVCEPLGPFVAKLRPSITKYFVTKTSFDFASQHTPSLTFKQTDGATDFIGFSQDELVGMTLYNLIHPADMCVLSGHFKELFIKGYCDTGAYRLLGPRGGYCWVSTKAQLVQDTTGKPLIVNCVHYAVSGLQEHAVILTDFQKAAQQNESQPEAAPSRTDSLAARQLPNVHVTVEQLQDGMFEQQCAVNNQNTSRHVLVFVPAGPDRNDDSAIGGQLPSCPVTSAPSSTARRNGGGPFPMACEEALDFCSLSQQCLTTAATYANAADLSVSQVSPVAVVGQSKNNQLDNNNTGEQAVCASLAIEGFSGVRVEDKRTDCGAPSTSASVCSSTKFSRSLDFDAQNSFCSSQEPRKSLSTTTESTGFSSVPSGQKNLQSSNPQYSQHEVLDGQQTKLVPNSNKDLCGVVRHGDVLENPQTDAVPDLVSSDDEEVDCPALEAAPSDNGKQRAAQEERELASQVPPSKAAVHSFGTVLTRSNQLLGYQERHYEESNLTEVPEQNNWSEKCWRPSILFEKPAITVSQNCAKNSNNNTPKSNNSEFTSTLSVFAPRTEEMSPGFLHIKEGQVLTCEEPNLDLTHLAPTAGDSAMPLEVEFEVCDEIPENLFPSLLDSAGSSPLSTSPYDDLTGYSDLPPALLDGISDNLQLETDGLLLPTDWPLPSSSLDSKSGPLHRDRKTGSRSLFRNSTSSSKALHASSSSKPMLAALLQSDLVPSSVSQKQRGMVHDWGGTTQPLPESMQASPKKSTPVKFVPQKVQSSLTINALKRPLSVSQRNSIETLTQHRSPPAVCPLKRRKTIDSVELQPKPVEKSGSVLMKLLVSGEDLPNGYSCRLLHGQRDRSEEIDKERDLRSAQDFLCSLASQLDSVPGSVNSDSSDFCNLLSADDDILMALAAATQQ